MLKSAKRACLVLGFAVLGLSGCFARHGKLAFNATSIGHYERMAAAIEYPDVVSQTGGDVIAPPLMLSMDGEPSYWDLTLEDAVHLALVNSRVLRDLGGIALRSPEVTPTVYNPAIVRTDPRFGVDAALSEFDAIFSAQALGAKNDRPLNNAGGPISPDSYLQDVAVIDAGIEKRALPGTLFSLRHILDYDANTTSSNKFPTIWNSHIEGEFRQPLLQGAGCEYNSIAGLSGIPGQANGVLVARVNTDISLADFEIGVRNLVSNVENAYWDLYFAYRDLDAKIAARNAALESWQRVHALFVAGRRGGEAEREAEAREQYFRFQEEVQNALSGRLIDGTQTNNGSSGGSFRGLGGVQVAERRLRLLSGLPINDGRLIRPAEEPHLAKVKFDWQEVMVEALVRRTELVRQKWLIKRRELELVAAKNYLLPQLDAVGLYRWRGLGDTLIARRGVELDRFDEAYDNLLGGYYQEWQFGMEFSVPLGRRRGHAAVRNSQLLLARERAILEEQERDVLLGLSGAVAEVDRAWNVAHTNYNRRLAAREQLAAVTTAHEADKADLDLVLEAQRRQSEADSRFFGSLSEYAIAVKNVHFEKGSLLDHNEIFLAEGPWPGKAYRDAAKRECRLRPLAALNYIFNREPLDCDGPATRQSFAASCIEGEGRIGNEVIAPPSPLSFPPAEIIPPGEMLPAPNAPSGAMDAAESQGSGVNHPIRDALRSAVWPARQ